MVNWFSIIFYSIECVVFSEFSNKGLCIYVCNVGDKWKDKIFI